MDGSSMARVARSCAAVGYRPALGEFGANRVPNEIVYGSGMTKAYFGFRRVNVHVHLFRRTVEEKQSKRIRGRRDEVVIARG